MEIELQKIRNKLIDASLASLVILILPTAVASASRAAQTGWQWIYSVHIGFSIITIFLFFFRRKLSSNVKTHILCILLLLISFAGAIKFSISGGFYVGFITALISTLIFGKRAGIFYSICSVIGLVIIAYLHVNRMIEVNVDFNVYNFSLSTWISIIISFIFYLIIIAFSVGLFYSFFIQNIKNLIENQKFTELITEQSPDIIYIYNILQNKNIYINKNIREILNYKKGEVPEDSIHLIELLIHPDDLSQFLTYEELVKNWDTEYVHQYEYRLKDANGHWRWFMGREKEFQRNNTKIISVIGVVTEVTLRKQTELELLEAKERAEANERRFELAVIGSTDGIWDWNLVNNDLYISPRWKEQIGYHDNELPSLFSTFENNIHPDDKAGVFELLDRYLNKRIKKYEAEFRFLHKNGNYIWIRARGEALWNEDGKAYRMSGSHSDITEAKLAEKALRKSESQLSSALNIALLGYWEYDLATDIFTFNDHFYKIFNTSIEKIGSYKMASKEYADHFLFPEDRSMVATEIQNLSRLEDSNLSRKLEHRIMHDDGSVGYISVEFFLIKDKNGKTIGSYGVNQNITERKLSEEKLRMQMEELQRWYNLTKGRENRILELKEEINHILLENGLPKKYSDH